MTVLRSEKLSAPEYLCSPSTVKNTTRDRVRLIGSTTNAELITLSTRSSMIRDKIKELGETVSRQRNILGAFCYNTVENQ
jgi:hypothetical protein